METQPGIVVAAEALRGWIHAQRATWQEPQRPSAEPLVVPAPPRGQTAFELDTILAAPPPAVTPDTASTALVLDAPALVQPETAPVAVFPPRWPSALRRVAAGLALLAALAGLAVSARVIRARYLAAPKSGTASFTSEPSGARVVVDGQPVGTTPVQVELAAGPHAVELRLNAATRTETIRVVRGQQTSFAVAWNAPRLGSLRISSTPDAAKVLVDGRERGVTPLTLNDVVVGSHTVQIDSSEGSVRRKINVVEGKTETLAESIYPRIRGGMVPADAFDAVQEAVAAHRGQGRAR